MALFKKKQKEVNSDALPGISPSPPQYPDLPRLPELPRAVDIGKFSPPKKQTYKLPTYPLNSFGQKFSQDTIKEAVTGGKEDEEVFDEDDFELGEAQMIQKPLRRPMRRDVGMPLESAGTEPVFIRIDRFEESMKIFDNMKRQITEIENMLKDIEMIREEEDRELAHWEKEVQSLKEQVERIDDDVFSKIE